MGPTASGKTRLAEQLADRLGAQLVNADAFQVYRGFDIGTAKPADRARYEIMDVCDPEEQFGVGAFVKMATEVAQRCHRNGQDVIVVGGTGLYIRALFEGYTRLAGKPDPQLRAELEEAEARQPGSLVKRLLEAEPDTTVDLNNPVRVRRRLEVLASPRETVPIAMPEFVKTKLGLTPPRDAVRAEIARRVRTMIESGWISEVQDLIQSNISLDAPAFRAIGYRLLASVCRGETGIVEATEEISQETVNYAKRQATWLRSEPGLNWIETELPWREEAWDRVLQSAWSAIGRAGQGKGDIAHG